MSELPELIENDIVNSVNPTAARIAWNKIRKYSYLTRWFQEKDLDVLNIASSFKGFGKSSYTINQALMQTLEFGLTCTKCDYEWITTKHVLKETAFTAIKKDNAKLNKHIKDIIEKCPKCKSKESVERTKKFNFKKYLAYDNEEIMEMVYKDLPPYSPIIADEAVNFMMGEDWNTKESKKLKKLFAVMRTKHLVVFANIPRFGWLDSKYREDMATFWLRIIKRGLAVMSIPDLGETNDAWHLKYFQDLLGNYNFFTPAGIIKDKVNKLKYKHPSVIDVIELPKVPDVIYEEYLKIRNEKAFSRRQEDNENINQKDYAKWLVYNLINNYDDFMKDIDKTRFNKPTTKVIANNLLKGLNDKDIVSYSTVSNWNNEIKNKVKGGKK